MSRCLVAGSNNPQTIKPFGTCLRLNSGNPPKLILSIRSGSPVMRSLPLLGNAIAGLLGRSCFLASCHLCVLWHSRRSACDLSSSATGLVQR